MGPRDIQLQAIDRELRALRSLRVVTHAHFGRMAELERLRRHVQLQLDAERLAGVESVTTIDNLEQGVLSSDESMTNIKSNLKKRHLNQDERRMAHNPRPDYIGTSRGDICRNTCALDVSDIVGKKLKTKVT